MNLKDQQKKAGEAFGKYYDKNLICDCDMKWPEDKESHIISFFPFLDTIVADAYAAGREESNKELEQYKRWYQAYKRTKIAEKEFISGYMSKIGKAGGGAERLKSPQHAVTVDSSGRVIKKLSLLKEDK